MSETLKIVSSHEKQVENIDELGITGKDNIHVKIVQGSGDLAQARLASPPRSLSRNMIALYGMCAIGFCVSSVNGYDGSLMGSLLVMKPFQEEFGSEVDGIKSGIINAMLQIGSVSAIPFVAESLDRFGRRFGMFIGCFLILVGTVIQGTSAISSSLGQYLAGRFLLGFGSSLAAAAAPTWIVEISHPAYRGILTGCYNCTYDLASIIAAGVTAATNTMAGNKSWLIPVWLQMVFPGITCIAIWFLPESPRWNFTHGRRDKAVAFLTKYHGEDDENNPYVQLQLQEFEECLELDGAEKRWWDYRVLFRNRSTRYRLLCSCMLSVWGAVTSGAIGSYVGAFFDSAGITDTSTVLSYNLGQKALSAVSAYAGASLCDFCGRRLLFLGAMSAVCLSWLGMTIGTAQFNKTQSVASAKAGIAFYFLFNVAFSFGVTPLQGLYPVEVLSYEMRAKGMAFSSVVSTVFGLVNQFGVPVAMERIGWKTYVIYTIWNAIEVVLSYFTMVETKGYTLEELDRVFESKNPVQFSTQRKKVVHDDNANIIAVADKEGYPISIEKEV